MNTENKTLNEYLNKLLHDKHIDRLHLASQTFDKAILNLCIATLGFTFAFIKLIPHSNPLLCTCLLIITWILLILSLMFILISFIADQKYTKNEIEHYQSLLLDKEEIPRNICAEIIMREFPKVSAYCFFLAIFIFTLFVYQNI